MQKSFETLLNRGGGVDKRKFVLIGISWYERHSTVSITKQAFLNEHNLSKAATEVHHVQRSVILKYVITRKI